MKTIYSLFICLLLFFASTSVDSETDQNRQIKFPDIPGFITLIADLHTHTVFSDGSVWPNIRVKEALKDGLDILAVTEHLEYRPHRSDIPFPDRNRSYELSVKYAEGSSLIVVNGAEITRTMPPGHANAIFITDANKLTDEIVVEQFRQLMREGKKEEAGILYRDSSVKLFEQAKKDGAFVFWNHPNWRGQQSDGIADLNAFNKKLIKNGLIQGIEIANEHFYSEEAHRIALKYNLTLIGVSDVHDLIDWDYLDHPDKHRPVTLIFAKSRSKNDIKEALFSGRTAVWFQNSLIGNESLTIPLLKSSIQIRSAKYIKNSSILEVVVENVSDAEYLLLNKGKTGFYTHNDLLRIRPNSETSFSVTPGKMVSSVTMKFEAINLTTMPKTHPEFSLRIDVSDKN